MSIDGGDKGSWSAEDLPPSWGWVSFNEFWTDHTDSKRKIPQNAYLAEGAFPVIDQGANLIGGYANDGTKKSLAPLPVIIFGDHTRAIKYVDRPFIQGADGVRVLCAAHGVDPLFAYHALRCVQLPDKGYSRHFRFLKATRFPLAPLSEQHRIVGKIGSLSAKSQRARDQLDHIPRLVEKYKQSILTAAFRGELTHEWRRVSNISVDPNGILRALREQRLRHKKSANRKTILAVPDVGLPETWTWVSPDEIADDTPYSIGIGPFGSNLVRSDYRDRGVRLIFVRDIRLAHFGDEGARYVTQEKASELHQHFVEGGSVLITKMGEPPGDTALYPLRSAPAVITADCIKLRPHPRLAEAAYLVYCIRSDIVREQIREITKGVAQQKVSLERFRTIALPIPPIAEQAEILHRIEATFAWIDRLATEATSARKLIDHLNQAILAKAFRGELVPQDANDEPASVLLERVRVERRATAQPRSRGRNKVSRRSANRFRSPK